MTSKFQARESKDTRSGPALLDSETLAGPNWLNLPSPRTLDQWAYQGRGPTFIKIGRHRRYDPSDVAVWIEQHKRSDPDAAA